MAERIGPGRPPRDPYDIIDYRTVMDDDGVTRTPVRVIDRIEETLKVNAFIHDAAARAGVGTETLRNWRTKGMRASADLLAGRKRRSDFDTHTKRCIELAERMERAEAEARTLAMGKLTQLASGGLEETKAVEHFDQAGQLTERREETRRLLPDARTLQWILTHRYPNDFAERVEISGPGGGPVEVEVSARDRLFAAVDAVRERMPAVAPNGQTAIEAESKPAPNGDETH